MGCFCALSAADHGRRLTDGDSLKGKVYTARGGAVSVQFRFAYKFSGKFREVLVGTWPKADITAIRKDRDALRVKLQNGIDPVAQSQLAREQVQSGREADHLRLVAEREAELLKIEADRQETVHQQQLRLQALAEKTARMTVRGLFEQWQRLELVQRADKGSEAQRSFERGINRVRVSVDRLTQWQCSVKVVCEFVADAIGIRSAVKQTDDASLWEMGVATGKKHSQMLCLQAKGVMVLVAGGNALPLADLIGYANKAYLIDAVMVSQLVVAAPRPPTRATRPAPPSVRPARSTSKPCTWIGRRRTGH